MNSFSIGDDIRVTNPIFPGVENWEGNVIDIIKRPFIQFPILVLFKNGVKCHFHNSELVKIN